MTQSKVNTRRLRWGVALLMLVLVLALGGCAVTERLGKSDAPAAAAASGDTDPDAQPCGRQHAGQGRGLR